MQGLDKFVSHIYFKYMYTRLYAFVDDQQHYQQQPMFENIILDNQQKLLIRIKHMDTQNYIAELENFVFDI